MPVFYGEYRREEAPVTFSSGQVHSDGQQMGELARLIDAGQQGHLQGKIVLVV